MDDLAGAVDRLRRDDPRSRAGVIADLYRHVSALVVAADSTGGDRAEILRHTAAVVRDAVALHVAAGGFGADVAAAVEELLNDDGTGGGEGGGRHRAPGPSAAPGAAGAGALAGYVRDTTAAPDAHLPPASSYPAAGAEGHAAAGPADDTTADPDARA